MTRGEVFADQMAGRAATALAGALGLSKIFAIGNVPFEVSAPPEDSVRWLGRALIQASGTIETIEEPIHRMFAWDGSDPQSFPPNRPWGPADHEPLGVVAEYSNDNVRCALDIHTGALIVFDYRRNASFTWVPDIAEMPAWAKASPFRIALSWLLNRHGVQMVHGAAVSIGNDGVLLAGPGGAGKSTTALACALSGMGYLGDDYCAVDPFDGSVHAVYRTAKVLPRTLQMLPRLAPMLVNADRIEEEKGVVFFDDESEISLQASAQLRAILVPRISGEAATSVSPASHGEVMRALLPSTIGGTMGGTPVTARLLLKLVQSLPGYVLNVGTDLNGVVDVVAATIRM